MNSSSSHLFSQDKFRGTGICLIQLIALLSLPAVAIGQADLRQDQTRLGSLNKPPEISIMVSPTSPDSARVAIAFRKRVDHQRVQKEIGSLASNGWKVSKVRLEDRSLSPGDEESFPPTTGATFTLDAAPQVVNNAPVLKPYLLAFRNWERLAFLFIIPTLNPYNGVEGYTDQTMSIYRVPMEGAYQYEAVIDSKAKKLSDVPSGGQSVYSEIPSGTPKASSKKTRTSTPSLFPIVLGSLGGIMIVGALLFMLFSRIKKG